MNVVGVQKQNKSNKQVLLINDRAKLMYSFISIMYLDNNYNVSR